MNLDDKMAHSDDSNSRFVNRFLRMGDCAEIDKAQCRACNHCGSFVVALCRLGRGAGDSLFAKFERATRPQHRTQRTHGADRHIARRNFDSRPLRECLARVSDRRAALYRHSSNRRSFRSARRRHAALSRHRSETAPVAGRAHPS